MNYEWLIFLLNKNNNSKVSLRLIIKLILIIQKMKILNHRRKDFIDIKLISILLTSKVYWNVLNLENVIFSTKQFSLKDVIKFFSGPKKPQSHKIVVIFASLRVNRTEKYSKIVEVLMLFSNSKNEFANESFSRDFTI